MERQTPKEKERKPEEPVHREPVQEEKPEIPQKPMPVWTAPENPIPYSEDSRSQMPVTEDGSLSAESCVGDAYTGNTCLWKKKKKRKLRIFLLPS